MMGIFGFGSSKTIYKKKHVVLPKKKQYKKIILLNHIIN